MPKFISKDMEPKQVWVPQNLTLRCVVKMPSLRDQWRFEVLGSLLCNMCSLTLKSHIAVEVIIYPLGCLVSLPFLTREAMR